MNPLCVYSKGICLLKKEETWVSLIALLAASVSPNIFPVAQAGLAKMSDLAIWFQIPSLFLLAAVFIYSMFRKLNRLSRHIWVGIIVGMIATIGLEVVRYSSFRLGGMPGNLPRLMGVLITDSFMQGPSLRSDILGYLYHYWNGACFGLIYSILFGHKSWYWGVAYGITIGFGFLVSSAVKVLGIGFMGLEMPTMPLTVIVAHVVYGCELGWLSQKWL